jgi:hypothetical protein
MHVTRELCDRLQEKGKGEVLAYLRQAGGQQDICVTKVTDFVYVIYP